MSATIDGTLSRGRRILSSLDGTVHYDEPFRLAFECSGEAFELAVTRITRFAFLLSAVLLGIVAIGAAPRMIGLIALSWLGAALAARAFAARRGREHGRVLVDFDLERVHVEPRRGGRFEAPLAGSKLRVVAATDALAPLWLWLALADGRAMRLAKSDERGLEPIVTIFRRYGVLVERDA